VSGSAISRRLMLALFGVTIVPILGWSVIVDLAEHLAVESPDGALDAPGLQATITEAKRRLVVVLGLSLATFTFATLYLRRVLVAPLESLAERARRATSDWQTPEECARNDEIGDLARALDSSVRDLAARVERARRFAADLSHELRTPLAAIQGGAELLAHEEVSSEEVRRFNGNILQESQRLGRLVEGILELERGAGHPRRSDEGCELCASIRHVSDALELLATRKQLRIEVDLPQQPAWVGVDSDRHKRVLFALLENAIKFSPPGGVIAVSLEARGDAGYRVVVADHGPGVALADRERIFERNAQSSAAFAPRGTGLGLAIARALVESWGGNVAVEARDGGGARFHYDVPLLQAPGLSASVDPASPEARSAPLGTR
jgi:two-component system sensor histidine kinase ChvG